MPTSPRSRPRPPATIVAAGLILSMLAVLPGATPSSVRAADPSPTPTPTATPAPVGPIPLGASVTFFGRGYGHGVGMSQYGARGRALAGGTAEEILAHYYQGATLGTIPLSTPIRVRVLKAFRATSSAPLVLYGRGGPWTIDGIGTVFPADARLTVTPSTSAGRTSWRVRVTDRAGVVLHAAATGTFRMRPAAAGTTLQVWSRPSSYDEYRGVLRVRLDTSAPTLNVIDRLPLEAYLPGVVPAEMPSTWPAEALAAQAIAARSYAARRLRPGVSYYDIGDEASSQIYLGKEAERAPTDAAIAASPGAVLRSGASIANTLFHSAGGGATEHNENAFVTPTGKKVASPVSYLRGSADRAPDGTPYDAASPFATWHTATYTPAQLSTWFAADVRTNVGALTALDLHRRGVSGRLISVTLVGSLGSRTVSGAVFRSVFNAGRPAGDPSMRSTLVDVQPLP